MFKRWMTALLCLFFMFFGMSISGWATSYLQEVKAYLNGELQISMDGKNVQLLDGEGKQVLPITYEGTTYLPIRSVAQLLNVDVGYDANAKRVILGDEAKSPDIPSPELEKKPIKQDDSINLVSWSDRVEDGEVVVTGSVQNRSGAGKMIGIVATGFNKDGKALETKGTSGYVSSGSVRNFSVNLQAEDIDYVEVEATGFAEEVTLLSDASRSVKGELIVTGVVENGTDKGSTVGIVATGYTNDGKAVETKGSSGYLSSGSVRNFSVTLSADSEIEYVQVQVTKED